MSAPCPGNPAAFVRSLAAGMVGAILIWSAPVIADPVSAARDDLDRLRGELGRLRHVQAIQQPNGGSSAGRLAQFEVRLSQLEEELRRLTGRIEQLEFGQRTVERRIDQLIADLDQRLAPLEGVRQPDGPQAEAAPGAADADANANPEEALQALVEQPGNAPAPAEEGTLGRVPQSALAGLPRPDPSTIRPPDKAAFTPQQQYDSAVELLRAGDYQGAENGLKLFLDLNPQSPLASNASYWLAESYYVRKNYAAAAAAFARNYKTYGAGDGKAPDNLLKLGMSLYALGEAEKACVSYDELSQAFADPPAHIQQAVARERDRAQCKS
jgi:tol-pal system protein YbgF